jgi:3D (Asp-Asp-Asp) domain-containing protein
MRLRTGHCAVDPKRIPYGSQIIFPDRSTLLAVDTGTAVRNRKAARKAGRTVYERNAIVVDRFFETKRQALTWTRQNPAFMTLRVVAPNYRAQTVAQSTLQKLPNPPPIASNAMLPASKPAAVKMSRVSLPKSGYKAL